RSAQSLAKTARPCESHRAGAGVRWRPSFPTLGGLRVRKLLLLAAMVVAVGSISSSAQAITYGTPTGTSYGNVGGLVTNLNSRGETVTPYVYCSGTLISPTVFLTDAHCEIYH